MANYSVVYTLTAPGGTVAFNSGADQYYLTNITGLDQRPIRAPVDDRPQTDGGLVHNFHYGPRHLTVEGVVYVTSSGTEAGVVTARNTMESTLIAALGSCLRADATLGWTPTGGSAQSLTVRCDIPVQFTGGYFKAFIFGLVSASG